MKNKLLAFVLLILPVLSFAQDRVNQIRLLQQDDSTKIEFLCNAKNPYKIFLLPNPRRLVVDLTDTRVSAALPKNFPDKSLISGARIGFPMPGVARIVFDLRESVKYKHVADDEKIIINVYAKDAPIQEKLAEKTVVIKAQTVAEPVKTTKPFVVVIDPGHGGKDPGAVGPEGTQEKRVVLMIAKRLAHLINQEPNAKAVLTRKGDYFVPLRERLKLARKDKADLFIAIHADSYFEKHASGASIYALSNRGATSEAARWLAKQENSALGEVDLGNLEDKSLMLRSVLIDLAQTATVTDSLRLGNIMLDALERVTKLRYQRVEQAPFVVLKSPDIPSVLVETGFISNPKEEKRLNDSAYQEKMAQALLSGIKIYLKKHAIARL